MGFGAPLGRLREIGYAETQSDFLTAASADVPGLTFTYTATGAPVWVRAWGALAAHSVIDKSLQVAIFEGATMLAFQKVTAAVAGNGQNMAVDAVLRGDRLPSVGSHTYKVRLVLIDAGTMALYAAPTYRGFLQGFEIL